MCSFADLGPGMNQIHEVRSKALQIGLLLHGQLAFLLHLSNLLCCLLQPCQGFCQILAQGGLVLYGPTGCS